MTDQSAGNDIAQRSAHGGAWNADPFATDETVDGDHTVVNRPANQAHLATPGAALESARGWRAQNGAVDFLGLDQELIGRVQPVAAQAPAVAPAPVAAAPAPMAAQPVANVPDESWLMEMGDHRAEAAEPIEEEPSPSPLLNAAWQEGTARPKRKRKLVLPLVACGVGAIALAGVALMRQEPPTSSADVAVTTAPVRSKPVAQATTKPTVNATQPVAAHPETAVVARVETPSADLGPIADLPSSASTHTEPPPLDVAVASGREPSAAPSPLDGSQGIDSMVEIVPAHVQAVVVTPPPSEIPGATPADVAPGEASAIEDPIEATTDQPVDDGSAPSINDYVRATAPAVEVASSQAPEPIVSESPAPVEQPVAARVSEQVPPENASVVVATPAPVAAPAETPTQIVAKVEPAASTPEPVVATPQPAPRETPVVSAAIVKPDVVGPSMPDSPAPEPRNESAYGPSAVASVVTNEQDAPSNPVGATSVQERTSKLELEQVLLLDDQNGMRRASVKDLQGVWSETTIPFESIGATSKVLTPSVGKVRVTLSGGEIFEGGLYAVGEGCVWIDTQYGRMGLAGSRVKTVQQIDAPKGTPALGAPGSQALSGMERVRIKTPGGVFYGKVIERDALRTTVMTDDGARLTLDSKDVELLTQVPTVTIKK